MATFSHVGFVQQSFLQFRMNIVIAVDLFASLSLVELSPVMCDFRVLSFHPSLIDLKAWQIPQMARWQSLSHARTHEYVANHLRTPSFP